MNLTINQINFNNCNLALLKSKNKEQRSYAQINLLSLNASLALKNQILFGANRQMQQKEALLQDVIKENSLPIQPQTLDFVLTPPLEKEGTYLKYSKTGSKFFELYSRCLLHKDYPIKDEGELTDIVADFIKRKNKSRIINNFIPQNLLPQSENKSLTQSAQADCLNAFLGAIIYENEDGFKVAFDFLNEKIGKGIYPEGLILEESPFEKLANIVEQKGYSWKDLYQETRFYNEQWHYKVHFKDLVLSEARGGKCGHGLREGCIADAIEKIESGEINFDEAGEDLTYINYKKPTGQRVEELKDFCQKWGLEFSDISLLHKAFLYGEMEDGSTLAHCDTYETLEYVGDAVLGFCVHEILQNNLPNATRREICPKRHYFTRNENLVSLAKEMKLPDYAINRNETQANKRPADMFEALIGAIFIDGKENGFDNAYEFLDKHFRDKICDQTY
ncbi:MAG: hypothetical protein IKU37_01070 [Candidatus Gastranaerophilales bacterium]|nr:hypothetical protein [Candidatus Gastranaerophilales bacterium]